MNNNYCIDLYYGTFDGCGVPSHSFEAADPEAASDDTISTRLAENLDTLVQRIKADAIKEYRALCQN